MVQYNPPNFGYAFSQQQAQQAHQAHQGKQPLQAPQQPQYQGSYPAGPPSQSNANYGPQTSRPVQYAHSSPSGSGERSTPMRSPTHSEPHPGSRPYPLDDDMNYHHQSQNPPQQSGYSNHASPPQLDYNNAQPSPRYNQQLPPVNQQQQQSYLPDPPQNGYAVQPSSVAQNEYSSYSPVQQNFNHRGPLPLNDYNGRSPPAQNSSNNRAPPPQPEYNNRAPPSQPEYNNRAPPSQPEYNRAPPSQPEYTNRALPAPNDYNDRTPPPQNTYPNRPPSGPDNYSSRPLPTQNNYATRVPPGSQDDYQSYAPQNFNDQTSPSQGPMSPTRQGYMPQQVSPPKGGRHQSYPVENYSPQGQYPAPNAQFMRPPSSKSTPDLSSGMQNMTLNDPRLAQAPPVTGYKGQGMSQGASRQQRPNGNMPLPSAPGPDQYRNGNASPVPGPPPRSQTFTDGTFRRGSAPITTLQNRAKDDGYYPNQSNGPVRSQQSYDIYQQESLPQRSQNSYGSYPQDPTPPQPASTSTGTHSKVPYPLDDDIMGSVDTRNIGPETNQQPQEAPYMNGYSDAPANNNAYGYNDQPSYLPQPPPPNPIQGTFASNPAKPPKISTNKIPPSATAVISPISPENMNYKRDPYQNSMPRQQRPVDVSYDGQVSNGNQRINEAQNSPYNNSNQGNFPRESSQSPNRQYQQTNSANSSQQSLPQSQLNGVPGQSMRPNTGVGQSTGPPKPPKPPIPQGMANSRTPSPPKNQNNDISRIRGQPIDSNRGMSPGESNGLKPGSSHSSSTGSGSNVPPMRAPKTDTAEPRVNNDDRTASSRTPPAVIGADQKPPPVRQYSDSVDPLLDVEGPPKEVRKPVTVGELESLRQSARLAPSNANAQLEFAKKLSEASTVLVGKYSDPQTPASATASIDAKTERKNRDAWNAQAHKIVKKLVNSHHREALFYMAANYGSGGLGLEVDYDKAYELYNKAAKMDHPESAYRVAVCNEIGAGTKRDPVKSLFWYRKAAQLGDISAMYKLGMISLHGLLGQPRSFAEGVTWLQRAADKADSTNPHAIHELGLLYERATPGDMSAVNQNGTATVIVKDEKKAFDLFTRAAKLGYPPSQYRLGSSYEYGSLGCSVDPKRSIAWYSRAAEKGEPESELALSGWYLTGSAGILQQSDTEAYLWARKAAEKGLAKAEYALGYFIEVGIGVRADQEEAKRWYFKAAAQKHPKALARLQELRSKRS